MMTSKLQSKNSGSMRPCRSSGLVSWASLLGGLLGMSCAGKFELGEVRKKLSDQPIVALDQVGFWIVAGPEDADAKVADDFVQKAGDVDGDGHADWIGQHQWNGDGLDVIAYGGSRPRDGILQPAAYGAKVMSALSPMGRHKLAPVGDVDGDGNDDLAMRSHIFVSSENRDQESQWGSQTALLVYGASGRPAGDVVSGAASLTSPGVEAFPKDELDRWISEHGAYSGIQGLELRALGDLDRDGYDDMALEHGSNLPASVPELDPESGAEGSGLVESTIEHKSDTYVFYGRPQRFGADAATNRPDAHLPGHGIEPLGDLDGDGFEDFVTLVDETFRLVRGGPQRLSDESDFADSVSVEFAEPQAVSTGVHALYNFTGVGDVDDDGYDDLAVSMHDAEGERPTTYLFYGRPALLTNTLYADFADAAFLHSVYGEVEEGNASVGLRGLEDWNGDGISDLLVNYGIVTGQARVLLGRPERYTGRFAVPFFEARRSPRSTGVSPIGDIDGDGLTDVKFEVVHRGNFLGTYIKFGGSSVNIIH